MEIEESPSETRPPMTREEIKKMFPIYVRLRVQGCPKAFCMNPDCAKYPGRPPSLTSLGNKKLDKK